MLIPNQINRRLNLPRELLGLFLIFLLELLFFFRVHFRKFFFFVSFFLLILILILSLILILVAVCLVSPSFSLQSAGHEGLHSVCYVEEEPSCVVLAELFILDLGEFVGENFVELGLVDLVLAEGGLHFLID